MRANSSFITAGAAIKSEQLCAIIISTTSTSNKNIVQILWLACRYYENVLLDEVLDENGNPRYKVVDDSIVNTSNEDIKIFSNIKLQKTKEEKISSLSSICAENIVKGIEYKGEYFSYKLEDQNELLTAVNAVKMSGGMPAPYHANGKLCKLYPAEDIIAMYSNQVINLTL